MINKNFLNPFQIFFSILLLSFVLSGCSINTSIEGISSIQDSSESSLVCDSSISNSFGGGDGSASNPYRICHLNQWKHFGSSSTYWDKSIKLESDLDFNGVVYSDFTPIGTVTNPFTGVFDGNNHTIKNINFDCGATNCALFLQTNLDVEIKNLKLQNFTLTATTRVSSLINLHEADGTLTLNNITLDGLTTSKATSGLIYRCKGPLVAQNISIANITAPLADYSSALVSILEDQGTFTDININSYTLTNVITFFTNLSGLVSNYMSNSPLSFTNVNIDGITVNGSSNSKVGSLLGGVDVFYTPNITVNSCNVINGFLRGKNTGGLLGDLFVNNLQVDNSSYEGSLPDGGNSTLGGLIGSMSGTSATINSSYVKSDVTVWTGVGGGLIGTTSATTVNINNSFYRGNVTSTDSSSGVVGGIFASMSAGTLTLTNVYAAGSVSGNFKKGCIGGYKPSGTLVANDVYYDSTLCTTNAVDSGAFSGITGSNTATMQPSSPFTNWSSGTWLFSLGFYPELQ